MRAVLSRQTATGAFPSEVAGMEDETCFVTASVALCLDPVAHRPALDRALDFIESCEDPRLPGAFAFYPPRGRGPMLVRGLPPDADDTALAWLALLHGGRRGTDPARAAFDAGIAPAACLMVPGAAPPWVRRGAVRTWLIERGRDNPVDLAVNANVLALACRLGLAAHPVAQGAAASLAAAAAGGFDPARFARRLAPYYADVTELWFAVRRAAALDDGTLGPVLEPVLAWLAPVLGSRALALDKPLYCNDHGRPVWRAPVLQRARRTTPAPRLPHSDACAFKQTPAFFKQTPALSNKGDQHDVLFLGRA
ncbi:prenyltransferase/squalene oxidase repeat-containing protein [Rhodobacter capsulatus]|uniref:Uncharacterized protein n=1 Tax=Rhodobacter capsulatus (strain ATCC BAA-309 / NBRC 16581 / SB1003) TaxID=272942 RepID=D5AQZ0_RHOCB|nr:hypothetical protein [Rhodobacter capsulatus]ADE84796.1 conserved hypothetical protein [Rhodobacter capsulatus SB 1003]MDS0925800.1 hypothetical protein [Rhodobacter capsulatus]